MTDNQKTPNAPGERSGLAAAGGSLAAAIASSACCWLPLLLIAFGTSAGGVSAWFEQYRLYFLIGAGVLLAIGFYLVYRPAPACEPGSVCATPKPGLRRFNQITLWVAAVLVIGFAAFPKYIGALMDIVNDEPAVVLTSEDAQAVEQSSLFTFDIKGMTCAACAVTLKTELSRLPGVESVAVDYGAKSAVLTASDDTIIPGVIEAAKKHGYTATVSEATAQDVEPENP